MDICIARSTEMASVELPFLATFHAGCRLVNVKCASHVRERGAQQRTLPNNVLEGHTIPSCVSADLYFFQVSHRHTNSTDSTPIIQTAQRSLVISAPSTVRGVCGLFACVAACATVREVWDLCACAAAAPATVRGVWGPSACAAACGTVRGMRSLFSCATACATVRGVSSLSACTAACATVRGVCAWHNNTPSRDAAYIT